LGEIPEISLEEHKGKYKRIKRIFIEKISSFVGIAKENVEKSKNIE